MTYLRIANYFNIIDKPNERSSHSYVTIRGGGIVFPAAILIWFLLFGFNYPWIIFATMLIAGISFMDDIMTLDSKVRILVHSIAVTILFWQLGILGLPWYIVISTYIFTIGWINAFNFMDGINGITAIYGLVALLSFTWLNRTIEFIPQPLISILIFSILIFSITNIRQKAKTFAGDVGSVTLAFILSWLMISLIIKTGRLEYILIFVVYGIDTVVTILSRLLRNENIFIAHRTHLYQYMSNELNWPHVLVSAIYGMVQLGINLVTIKLIASDKMTWTVFFVILFTMSSCYLIFRKRILSTIKKQS